MKTLIITIIALVSFSTFANDLKPLKNARVEVVYGGGFAAVQPYANLVFEYASCAKFSFSLDIEEDYSSDSKTFNVKVKLPINQIECWGHQVTRKYSLQLTSDFQNEKYVLLNPLAIEYRNN